MTSRLRNLCWLLAIVPLAFLLYTVCRYCVQVPYLDQWDLVPLLEKMYGGTLTLGDLWRPHNEHRLLFPQMMMLAFARLTDWNIYCELAVNIFLAICIFLVLVRQVRITALQLNLPELNWAIPVFAVIVFSVSQYQNWLWGWQLQIFLSVLGVIGGVVLLANPPFTWPRLFAAAALGIIASYSFGNGAVFWLIGIFVLTASCPSDQRLLRVTIWVVVSALTMGGYFYRYEKPEEHPALTSLLDQPLPYLTYVFKYLGNICAQYFGLEAVNNGRFALKYGIVGLAILVWTLLILRRNKIVNSKILVPYIALCLYSIGSALVTGIGRVGFGSDQAVSSRYCTVAAPFWASLVTLLLILERVRAIPQGRKGEDSSNPSPSNPLAGQRAAATWLLRFVIFLLVLSSIFGVRGAADIARVQQAGQQFLLSIPEHPSTNKDYSFLSTLHNRPEIILERFPFLKRNHLTVFRNESPTGNPP